MPHLDSLSLSPSSTISSEITPFSGWMKQTKIFRAAQFSHCLHIPLYKTLQNIEAPVCQRNELIEQIVSLRSDPITMAFPNQKKR